MILQLLSNSLELFSSVKTFWENHVCSCINVTLRSLDTFIQSINTFGIGSRTNNELTIRNLQTCLSCDSDFINHLICWNELLSVQMTASFWEDLIFDVKSTCSTVEEISDSSSTHLSFTKSGISISNDW